MSTTLPLKSRLIDLPDAADAAFDQLYALGVTDGLPVIPPTDGLVQRFISAAGRPADACIAIVPPLQGAATVEKIAINAVMAGCRPEYMPLLITIVEAVSDPAFNLLAIQTTTNPVAPLILVNGPVRHALEINGGRGALGPGRRANATLGRALRLIQLNLGGALPGEVDKATLGMPGKYTLCLAELEEESPWEPLHVERGLKREQSAVTVVGVQGTENTFVAWKKADSIFRCIGSAMASLGANNTLRGKGNPILLLNPGHAKLLAEQGYGRRDVQRALYEHSKIPVDQLPRERIEVQGDLDGCIVDGHARVTAKPEDILIAVAGGPEAYHVTWCASFGDPAVTRAVGT